LAHSVIRYDILEAKSKQIWNRRRYLAGFQYIRALRFAHARDIVAFKPDYVLT
jgi:hypothetical protein